MRTNSDSTHFAYIFRKGALLYLDSIMINLIGYVYWVVIGQIGGAESVGYASVTISLAWIIQGIILFGLPIGLQRFVGKSFGKNNFSQLSQYFMTAYLFTIIMSSLTTALLVTISFALVKAINIANEYITLASILVFLTGVNSVIRYFLISILEINKLFIFDFIASVVRLISGIYLVLIGLNGIGAAMGFIFSNTLLLILFSFYLFLLFKKRVLVFSSINFSILKDLLRAGFVSWAPQLITTLGVQLGLLILFNFQGAFSTGVYFLAFAIFNVVFSLPNTFLGLLFPILSSMDQGHSEITKRMINIMLFISTPLAAILGIYSRDIMSALGFSFLKTEIWVIIFIFSLSIPFICIINGINNLVYALGKYKAVLYIGTSMSVVRVISYFLMTSYMGAVGTALSFDFGLIPAFLLSIYYAKTNNVHINTYISLISIVTPYFIGYVLLTLNIPWYIGVIVLFSLSEVIFLKIKLTSKEEIMSIVSILSFKFK